MVVEGLGVVVRLRGFESLRVGSLSVVESLTVVVGMRVVESTRVV